LVVTIKLADQFKAMLPAIFKALSDLQSPKTCDRSKPRRCRARLGRGAASVAGKDRRTAHPRSCALRGRRCVHAWHSCCFERSHRAASFADGVRSVDSPGGKRARAMLMRQPDCETEVVPSLHSNLAGAASPSGSTFCSVAACWGAGTCATGFCDQAQPAHESEINRTAPVRIRVASGKPRARPKALTWSTPPDRPVSSPNIQRLGTIRT
jgi:hypothetical protein